MMVHSSTPAEYFGAKAINYKKYATSQLEIAQTVAMQVQTLCDPTGVWLDIGCGPDVLTHLLFKNLPSVTPILLDIAEPTLNLISPDRIRVCADMSDLPISNNSIDGVTATSSLQWAPSMSHVFSEVYRVLKPKGIFSAAIFTDLSLHELHKTQRHFGIDSPVHYPTTEWVCTNLINTGFHIVAEHTEHFTENFTSGFEALRAISRIGAGFHGNSLISPATLRRFVSYFESQFSGAIQNRYVVSFFTASRD